MTAFDEEVKDVSENRLFPGFDEPPPLVLQQYEFFRTLGTGRSSVVKEAKCKKSGNMFAIKIIASETHPQHDTEVVLAKEALVLKKLNHPNCVQLHKVIYCSKHTYLILNRVNGNTILDRIQFTKGISEVDAVQSVECLCKAMQHLHGQAIAHRSIVPQNIIYASASSSSADYNKVVLGGFHSASFTAPASNLTPFEFTDRDYMAPEVAAGSSHGSVEADLYSVGILIFHMLAGELPSDGKEGAEAGSRVTFEQSTWAHVSPSAKELISSFVAHEPSQRPALSKVLEHRWVKADGPSSVNRLPPSHRAMILLRELPQFQGLGIKCLQEVSERLELVSVPAGQFLFRAGDAAESIFFLSGGSVQLINNGEPQEVLAERGCFAHRQVLDATTHTMDAKSLGGKRLNTKSQIPSEGSNQDVLLVFRLSKSHLDELLVTYPNLRTSLEDAQPSSNNAGGSANRLITSPSKNMVPAPSADESRVASAEGNGEETSGTEQSRTCAIS